MVSNLLKEYSPSFARGYRSSRPSPPYTTLRGMDRWKLPTKTSSRESRECHQGWVEDLPLVLWAYRTTLKRSNEETPFSLAYGTEVVLPAEIQVLSNQTANTEDNEENLRLNLDLVEERREAALIREASYKKTIEKYYNKRVKRTTFKVGDYVL
ncbi:uncharacterized protein [Rutidosis leptorrhynchoides]|uniref:uncharacterized protein n=1 Tax=Rutidosis leptorrhynchoides TaxID=125765 RepID=UPI003A99E5CD